MFSIEIWHGGKTQDYGEKKNLGVLWLWKKTQNAILKEVWTEKINYLQLIKTKVLLKSLACGPWYRTPILKLIKTVNY